MRSKLTFINIKSLILLSFLSITVFFCLVKTTLLFADTPSALSRANPVIQVESYEILSENIELDGSFDIMITAKNNNAYATAYNVICEAQTPDMDLHLTDGQVNQIYFQSIAPNETVSFTQTFYIEKTFPYKCATLTYKFSYSDESGSAYTNSTSLSPKITIPCKLKINVLSVASKASLGSRSLVNVRCTNDGTIDISGITMHLSGDIPEEQQEFELGELKSGEQLMKDCYVNFMKSGSLGLKISFSYKDEAGNTYTIPENTYPVSVSSEKVVTASYVSSTGGGATVGGRNFSIKSLFLVLLLGVPIIYVAYRLIKSMKKGR